MRAAKDVPERAVIDPRAHVRTLRSLLRMSQAQLARRAGVPQAHIARIEAMRIDVRFETLRGLYDCLFCDLIVLPRPRKRPTDVVAERELFRLSGDNLWDDVVRIDRKLKWPLYSRVVRQLPLVVALAFSAATARAQARVSSVEGSVQVAPAGMDDAWLDVKPGYSFKAGDRLRTAKDASAVVDFADKSRVTVSPRSELALDKAAKGDASVRLEAGRVDAAAAAGSRLSVKTPAAAASQRGGAMSVDVASTLDTQVVVDRGVAQVTLKNGQKTELGADRPYRSLQVIPGRGLDMLPHPREDAPKKDAKSGLAKGPDCLHKPDGSLRASVEEIEACQGRARKRMEKAGALSSSDGAMLRERDRDEIKRFLEMTGQLPQAGDADEAKTEPRADPTAGATDPDVQALKRLVGDADDGSPGLTSGDLDKLQQALASQTGGGDPGVQSALGQARAGGQVSPETLRTILQALKKQAPAGVTIPEDSGPPDPSKP